MVISCACGLFLYALRNTNNRAPPTSMLLWGATHYIKNINVMRMIGYAHKSLLEQQGAALLLLSCSTVVQWHCRARSAALPH
jgi:hypothetical protein